MTALLLRIVDAAPFGGRCANLPSDDIERFALCLSPLRQDSAGSETHADRARDFVPDDQDGNAKRFGRYVP
ncbi:MAG: hypothetical protein AAF636_20290 [Pseudomonadota bacterium]